MTISVAVQIRGLTAEEDTTLLEALDLEGSAPAGARTIRTAGPQGGGRRIRAVWDSDADYERFRDDRLVPALRSLGRALEVTEAWPATETTSILRVA